LVSNTIHDLVLREIAALDASARPRLRFDKVANEFVNTVGSALSEAVPDGQTVIVTITAPIRQGTKTAAELVNKMLPLLRRSSAPTEMREEIHGNDIRVRLVSAGSRKAAKTLGFVHNPGPGAAEVLLDIAASCVKARSVSTRAKSR